MNSNLDDLRKCVSIANGNYNGLLKIPTFHGLFDQKWASENLDNISKCDYLHLMFLVSAVESLAATLITLDEPDIEDIRFRPLERETFVLLNTLTIEMEYFKLTPNFAELEKSNTALAKFPLTDVDINFSKVLDLQKTFMSLKTNVKLGSRLNNLEWFKPSDFNMVIEASKIQIDGLEKAVQEEAKKANEYYNEISSFQNSYLAFMKKDRPKNLKSSLSKLEVVKVIKQLKDRIVNVEDSQKKMSKNYQEKLQVKDGQIKKIETELRTNKNNYNSNIKKEEKKFNEMKKKCEQEKDQKSKLERIAKDNAKIINDGIKEKEKLESEIASNKQAISDRNKKIKQLEKQVDKHKAEVVEILETQELKQKESEISIESLETELKRLQKVEKNSKETKKKLDRAEKTIRDLEKERNKLKNAPPKTVEKHIPCDKEEVFKEVKDIILRKVRVEHTIPFEYVQHISSLLDSVRLADISDNVMKTGTSNGLPDLNPIKSLFDASPSTTTPPPGLGNGDIFGGSLSQGFQRFQGLENFESDTLTDKGSFTETTNHGPIEQ